MLSSFKLLQHRSLSESIDSRLQLVVDNCHTTPYRLAFSSNCTDLESGPPVAQLAVRSRVASAQPFSEWSLLHYYSHDYNGERLTSTQYIIMHGVIDRFHREV